VNTQGTSNALNSAVSPAPNTATSSESPELQEEYIWRFHLEENAGGARYKDPLLEMVRVFLDDFLHLGFLTYNGEPVRVTGFAFNNEPREIYEIFLDDEATLGKDQHERLTPLVLEPRG